MSSNGDQRAGITRVDVASALVLACVLTLVAFTAGGGDVDLPANTWVEIALTVLGFGLVTVVVLRGASAPAWGAVTLLLFAALAGLTALSVAWSVVPDKSWIEAGRTAGYLGAFAAAMATCRLAPERWRSLIIAIALTSVALSGWAALAKVFPASLDPQDHVGRLLAPFGYWNATGLMAALGLAPCLWLGAREEGSAAQRAAAVPAIALLISVVVLSYSRSALLAAVIGVAIWFAAVPGRLRGVLVLGLGGLGAIVIAGWALGEVAFTDDQITLPIRASEGHTFGVILVVVFAALAVIAYLVLSRADHVSLSAATRRRIGTVLICLLALVPIAAVGKAAVSARGLTGEVSHVWSDLTTAKSVGDNPGRLVDLANSRPSYWREGLTVGEHALLAGVGADGFGTAQYRYTDDTAIAADAHSYVIQTFADLGLIGLALSFGLLIAWSIASARPLRRRRGHHRDRAGEDDVDAFCAERAGMWSLLCAVVAFGVGSTVDWTWFYPGVAVPALVCAGWLAARGPLDQRVGVRPRGAESAAAVVPRLAATALAAVAVLIAWAIWQPLRSIDADNAATTALIQGNGSAALADANSAAASDPVAVLPLWELSDVYSDLGEPERARAEALNAVNLQPENPQSWGFLGAFYLSAHEPRPALSALERAHALDLSDPIISQELANARAGA